jgi:translation initiation factor 2 beta subunit (eIF-2beta)/eIF-5
MVHYGRPEQPKNAPLQLCGKCGSHRTQVIGRLEDGKTLIIRCNACGAHSTVISTRPMAQAPIKVA